MPASYTVVRPSGELLVNTNTTGTQDAPSVARLSDGGWVVSWTSIDQDGDGAGVYQQRYTAAGATSGSETLVNTFTAGDQSVSAVTGLADGGWVVTWQSLDQDGSGYGIYQQRYTAAGAATGGEVKVNTTTAQGQSQATLASLPAADGGWVVVWQSDRQDGSGTGIYQQRYTAAGAASGGEVKVNTTTASFQLEPAITVLADGGWVVTWSSLLQDGSGLGIYQQRYDATGAASGGEVKVNTTTASDQHLPAVAALGDGGWVVVWASDSQDGDGEGVYQQRYSAAGATVGGEVRVNTTTAGAQSEPAVAASSDGGWIVTWESLGADADVLQQRYDASGAPVLGETRVNVTTDDDQDLSAIAALPGGSWVVTWASGNQDGSDFGVYQRLYTNAGTAPLTGAIELVAGSSGDDVILADPGGLNAGDLVDGGAGNDVIALTGPGTLDFTLATLTSVEGAQGSAGADTFIVSGSGAPGPVLAIAGGGGVDTVSYAGSGAAIYADLRPGAGYVAGALAHTFSSIENLIGGSGSDTLVGNDEANRIAGSGGTDQLYGFGADDTLVGGTALAGTQNQLFGGAGQDTVDYSAQTASVYVELRAPAGYVGGALTDLFDSIENAIGGTGDDLLVGNDGSNRLAGGGGTDQLYGFAGADTFVGGTAAAGTQNQIFGGDGPDTIDYSAQTASVYLELRSPAGYVGSVLKDFLNSVENGIGGSGDDTLVGTDSEANVLNGGGGTDLLFGLAGDDVLVGGLAASGQYNQLFGGDGQDTASYAGMTAPVHADLAGFGAYLNQSGTFVLVDAYSSIENLTGSALGDVLVGDAGANRIGGGGGADVLYGRGGPDVFVYLTAADSNLVTGYDALMDFATGIDKVDLSAFGIDASRILIGSNGITTALYADTDLGTAGYELAVNVQGANSIVLADIIF